jgi:hypothetical protein
VKGTSVAVRGINSPTADYTSNACRWRVFQRPTRREQSERLWRPGKSGDQAVSGFDPRPRQFAGPALSPADVESVPHPGLQTPIRLGIHRPAGPLHRRSWCTQVARPHSTKTHRSAEALISGNRRIEKLVGAARDLLERRISLLVLHPIPRLDQRRSADVCQAYVWLARTADR